jgi:hypothetical protein
MNHLISHGPLACIVGKEYMRLQPKILNPNRTANLKEREVGVFLDETDVIRRVGL